METREKFGSRLGFILISAGCAIGLGNVWRFPFIVGQYGGASFVLIYLFFLLILGLPIMAMEFSVGRASQKSVAKSFQVLEPPGSKWHIFSYFAMAGNYLLMMFYTTVAGWMVAYLVGMARGDFKGLDAEGTGAYFDTLLASPARMVFWMCLVVGGCFLICSIGLQKGVEKVTKTMMLCLLIVMIGLVIRCVTLPGAGEGLSFYLMPRLDTLQENGIWNSIYAAMGQAFFTLSIGMGSMAIFGSYINKDRTLFGEAVSITALDTFVAVMAGMIIFPACFAFGVNPGAGPGLIFVTLPNVFNSMPASQIWGTLFFVFMGFAAFSTVIAVFENIISFGMDLWGWSRKKTAYINIIFIVLLSLPCVFGFNLLSGVNPLGGDSTILDLEDFIVSNNILPLGSLIYLAFCVSRYGWGWDKFIQEADSGKGLKFPKFLKGYVTWVLPLIVLFIFVMGYAEKFFIN